MLLLMAVMGWCATSVRKLRLGYAGSCSSHCHTRLSDVTAHTNRQRPLRVALLLLLLLLLGDCTAALPGAPAGAHKVRVTPMKN
jgi:hypothetical protein